MFFIEVLENEASDGEDHDESFRSLEVPQLSTPVGWMRSRRGRTPPPAPVAHITSACSAAKLWQAAWVKPSSLQWPSWLGSGADSRPAHSVQYDRLRRYTATEAELDGMRSPSHASLEAVAVQTDGADALGGAPVSDDWIDGRTAGFLAFATVLLFVGRALRGRRRVVPPRSWLLSLFPGLLGALTLTGAAALGHGETMLIVGFAAALATLTATAATAFNFSPRRIVVLVFILQLALAYGTTTSD